MTDLFPQRTIVWQRKNRKSEKRTIKAFIKSSGDITYVVSENYDGALKINQYWDFCEKWEPSE